MVFYVARQCGHLHACVRSKVVASLSKGFVDDRSRITLNACFTFACTI